MRNRSNQKPGQPKFQIDYNNFKNQTEIQDFINKQLWATGGDINTSAGNTVSTTVKWGGQSRFLIGFNFYAFNPDQHLLSLVLNNETMIDSVPLNFFVPNGFNGNIQFYQYFEFIRPLSGSDTMVISLNSAISEQVGYGIYMTRAYNRYYARD